LVSLVPTAVALILKRVEMVIGSPIATAPTTTPSEVIMNSLLLPLIDSLLSIVLHDIRVKIYKRSQSDHSVWIGKGNPLIRARMETDFICVPCSIRADITPPREMGWGGTNLPATVMGQIIGG